MKKITRRNFLKSAAAGTVAAGLAGCGASSSTATSTSVASTSQAGSSEESKEIPVISAMTAWEPGYSIDSNYLIFTHWGEQTGVQFDMNIPPRDSYQEKVNTTLAGGDIPDLMRFFQDSTTFKEYGPDLFVNLSEYIDSGKLPNYASWLEKYPDAEYAMKSEVDGNIYGFGIIQNFDYINGGVWTIRNDILNAGGMDVSEIKTIDDIKEAFLILQEQIGGGYITSARLGFDFYQQMSSSYFVPTGFEEVITYSPEKGGYDVIIDTYAAEYKEYVEFEHWMYENGLLHPDFLTMSDQELLAAFDDGSFPLCRETFGIAPRYYTGNPEVNVSDVKNIDNFELLCGSTSFRHSDPHANIGYRSPWVINKESEHIDEIVAAMDWMYSEEGIMFNFYGIEGEHYELDDAEYSGIRRMNVKSDWTILEDGTYPDGMMTLLELTGCDQWWTAGVIPPEKRFATVVSQENAEQAGFLIGTVNDWTASGQLTSDVVPQFATTSAQTDELESIFKLITMETYVSENVVQFITGTRSMSEWDAYLAELHEKFDLSAYAAKMNEFYSQSVWSTYE